MNKTNFNQTGGFPLKTERLQELETAYKIFNAFGALAGNLTIISGCETVGSTIKNGFVYIDGELLEFREGTISPNVIIIEEPVNRAFENGTVKTVHTIRYATFGTSDISWPWAYFVRPIETKTLQAFNNSILGRLQVIETKLATIETGAEKNVQSDWNVSDAASDAFIKNKISVPSAFLYRGSYSIGDSDTDEEMTVTFPNVGTSSYYVLGSLRITGSDWNESNDAFWNYAPINATSFKLYTREVASRVQSLAFDYIIIAR